MNLHVIGPGTEVTLHFALKLESGEIIDSNFEGEPATFVFGDGKILPGFENTLVGLCASDKRTFAISPENAFGLPNEGNIQHIKPDAFDASITLEPGLVVNFTDASGGDVPGVIREVNDQHAEVDFNHPLAGRVIIFDVEIIEVKPSVTH